MFSWLLGNRRTSTVGGLIGYHGLSSWWIEELSHGEREYLESVFKPMGALSARPLTEGRIMSSSQSSAALLTGLAGWVDDKGYRDLRGRIVEKATALAVDGKDDVESLHFALQEQIRYWYRRRNDDEQSLGKAIDACEQQIAIAPAVAKYMRRKYRGCPLPSHVGFSQLITIRKKQKDFDAAIRLCIEAGRQKWNGDWEEAAENIRRKAAKAK